MMKKNVQNQNGNQKIGPSKSFARPFHNCTPFLSTAPKRSNLQKERVNLVQKINTIGSRSSSH
jgi:hypothetical protein